MGPTRPWSGISRNHWRHSQVQIYLILIWQRKLFITSQDFVKTIFSFATVDSSSFESAIVLDQSAIGQSVRKMEFAQWLNIEFHRLRSNISIRPRAIRKSPTLEWESLTLFLWRWSLKCPLKCPFSSHSGIRLREFLANKRMLIASESMNWFAM